MKTLRIAAWSGPRNISTAMMRSWENRSDTCVIDEPLYAHYLRVTGLDHPGREEVLAHHDANWKTVIKQLVGPCEYSVFYQKHMTHHLLPNISRDWLYDIEHLFLIREPREMLTSLKKQIPHPTLEDTGLPQQVELLGELKAIGKTPLILDSKDVLENPEAMLSLTCEKLGIRFDEAMLSWPSGSRDSDGTWATHWYASVNASTGFEAWKPKEEQVPAHLKALCLECEALYCVLKEEKLESQNATEV